MNHSHDDNEPINTPVALILLMAIIAVVFLFAFLVETITAQII
jgi:hypothetical protein